MSKLSLLKLLNACFHLILSHNEGERKKEVENIDHQEGEERERERLMEKRV